MSGQRGGKGLAGRGNSMHGGTEVGELVRQPQIPTVSEEGTGSGSLVVGEGGVVLAPSVQASVTESPSTSVSHCDPGSGQGRYYSRLRWGH